MGKKKNKQKVSPLFIFITVVICLAVFAGMFCLLLWYEASEYEGVDLRSQGARQIVSTVYWIIIGIDLLLCGASWLVRIKSQKVISSWDGEESTAIEKIERILDIGLFSFEAFNIITFLAVGFHFFTFYHRLGRDWWIVGLVLVALFMLYCQGRLKRLMQKMGPGKKGYVYSSFYSGSESMDNWMRTSDEGERMIVYQAAYCAYLVLVKVTFTAMLAAMLLIAGTGSEVALAVFVTLGFIWILANSVFCYQRNKLKKGNQVREGE